MSDELKDKFRDLVANTPPPSAVPSEAVFAKVRTVRRRRTAGVAVLAAAAVVSIAVAGSSLADVKSNPPVTSTPGAPTTIVTGPPTTAAPETPRTTGTPGTTGSTRAPGSTGTTGSPAGSTTTGTTGGPTTTRTPALPPIGTSIVLKPKINGRSMVMTVSLRGTVRVPRDLETGEYLAGDTSYLNLSLGTDYDYGDGGTSGSDGGTVTCKGSNQRRTGAETYTLLDGPHVYAKPGTYTFRYTVRYCGAKSGTTTTKTLKIVIR